MVTIVPRAAWGFDGWRDGVAPVPVSPTERHEYMLHYDGGTPVGDQTGPAMIRAIHAFHKLVRGWAGIGYSFVIDQAGVIYEGRGWDLIGAHCPGHNRSAVGIQIHIGGDEQPSAAAMDSAIALYAEATRHAARPLARLGHRDGYPTDCPGVPLYAWVRAGMPAPATTPREDPDMDAAQANQLFSTYAMMYVPGGDVGPATLPQRVDAIAARLDEIAQSLANPTPPAAQEIVAAALAQGATITITPKQAQA